MSVPFRKRHGGVMVSALDFGASGLGSSPGQGHCVVFFGKTLLSQCLSTPRCREAPSRGEQKYLFHATETNSGLMDHFAHDHENVNENFYKIMRKN